MPFVFELPPIIRVDLPVSRKAISSSVKAPIWGHYNCGKQIPNPTVIGEGQRGVLGTLRYTGGREQERRGGGG